MSVTTDVDRGLQLRAEIAEREHELKGIIARLEQAALTGKQIALEDAEREGKQFLATGTREIVPVIISSDELMGSFTDGSPAHTKVAAVAGDSLASFFKKTITWERIAKDGKRFRAAALQLLGKDAAPPFISACVARDKAGIPKSKITVQWDRVRPLIEEQA
jgi:hypothetical protein